MKITSFFKNSLAFLICLISMVSFSQKDFQGKAYYETKTTVDMSNFGGGQLSEERKKQIADRMKSALEKTYILTFNHTESIYKEEEKLEAPSQGGGMRFGMMNFTGGNQYKNVKEQQLLQESELFGKQFLIADSLPKLNWELGSESKMIGQYMCFKATAVKNADGFDFNSFRRRNSPEKPKDSTNNKPEEIKETPKQIVVTAWYTPQISVSQGPGEYWGLPGLILEVNADRTTILCSKIVLNPSEKDLIKAPSKGKSVTKTEYDAIVKQKMEEMREMFRGRGGRGTSN
ncbi:MAG: GLPGLI family protein [Flavobacteriales bacterium]|nr:GLPGLI family protein [Flavobacteriia bacterium]NCP06229.1 GLPGLI family protein [Flavobacteriales bacterium]PIV92734.1 MAG: GLPGLI family protein [Flavobacteriaceae bacterium CG17_big_fil_post_rev_8_21_14_2_50_33_15]NCP52600.1 GLPGLI family protein [Flavobacteriales bacterium]NCP61241.1 GLPGLI family protein [Flavobacteriales bacterium]